MKSHTIGRALLATTIAAGCAADHGPVGPEPEPPARGAWSTPRPIVTAAIFEHRLAAGPAGDLVLFFEQCASSRTLCRLASARFDGDAWSPMESIAGYEPTDIADLAGAVDLRGEAFAVWGFEELGFDHSCPGPDHTSFVRASRSVPGSPWTAQESLLRPFTGAAAVIGVISAEDGTVIALLGKKRFNNEDLCEGRKVPAEVPTELLGTWSRSNTRWAVPESVFTGTVFGATLAPTSDGAWVAASIEPRRGAPRAVEVRHFKADNSWTAPETIAEEADPPRYAPFVGGAADGQGRVIVVWKSARALWSAWFDPTTGWSPANRFVQGADDINEIAMSSNLAGDVVVVWSEGLNESGSGPLQPVRASRTRIGGAWAAPAAINQDERGSPVPGVSLGFGSLVGPLDVAVDPQGGAMVLWAEKGATLPLGGIWSNSLTARAWSGALKLPQDGTHPHVRFDHRGRAIGVWERNGDLVWSQFDPNATR